MSGPVVALPQLVAPFVPRHKAVDLATALGLLRSVIRVLGRPHPKSVLIADAVLGVVTLAGRNHGLYRGVALAGAGTRLH